MINESINNETLQNIKKRHSIRKFSEEPVSKELIEIILQAANQAPSAHNQQSWRFIVIQGEKKKELVELITTRAADFPKAAAVLLRMASRSIASAPVVIAIANTGDLIEHGTNLFGIETENAFDFFRTMEIQSSAAAAENLLLAVTSLGLAGVWLGILYLIKDEVLSLLNEPKGEFMAVIPVGYPVASSKGPTKRPLEVITKHLS